MQHVKISWLRWFNYSLVGMTVILYITYILFNLLQVSQATQDHWGIDTTVLAMGAIHAIYVIIADSFVIKKNPWLPSVISFAMWAFILGALIEASGNTNIVYRGIYIIGTFFAGMLGLYAPLTTAAFTWMLLILTVTGIATPTNASLTFNLIADTLLTLSGIAGWLFFRQYYVTSGQELRLRSQLQEEQFKSSVILESISDGVMIINNQGTVEILNESSAELLGWDHKEATHLDYKSLIQPMTDQEGGVTTDAITECFRIGRPVQHVSLLTTRHNRQLYVDIVASPIKQPASYFGGHNDSEKSVGVVAVLRDVDAQRRQEQQRSDFISTASHEMRTPVAAIQGFIELALNDKVSQIDDKARGYLTKADEATKHLGALFQDLLTASKSEDGRLVSNPELLDVNECLSETVEQSQPAAEQKGLKLRFIEPQSSGLTMRPLAYAYVDKERLHEVINNLIENALKYTKRGEITVGTSIKDRYIIIRVSDTGVGIATEDIPHLFQKFYRTDNSATREVGGTGLGLYITKQIVEFMGGRVWVESVLGVGSTFFVQLPRVSPDKVAELKASKPQAAQATTDKQSAGMIP